LTNWEIPDNLNPCPESQRVCVSGYPHHITQRGNNKERVFFDEEDRGFYLDLLRRYKEKYEMKILAYCLMGNHVHVLSVPERETSLARGIGGTSLQGEKSNST